MLAGWGGLHLNSGKAGEREGAKNGGNSQSINGFHDYYTYADEFYSRVVSINLTIDR
ncbi:hypothetical protein KQS06HV_50940 [Klebsiella quasipneumoniae subsp. similipneumoniae]|nr:hypothetical protein KQS06HV_50940 [Klebsiella quasipneumoniae subsp. similipneumoniae]